MIEIPGEPSEPTELAHGIADLVSSLPEEAVADLERLLALRIAGPTSAELREARLGLLVEIVSLGSGEVPTVRIYEAERQRRALSGEIGWPAPSSLIAAYGDFRTAVRAAMRLAQIGGRARVASSHGHARFSGKYTRAEAIEGLRRFREATGDWPRTTLEWSEWSAHVRRLARDGGQIDPRLPSIGVLRRLFGGFGRAVALARER